jgi:ubiquinone/menaquinone biosynthesis C-methylase UbiE
VDKEKVKENTRKTYDRVGSDYDGWYWAKSARKLRAGLTEKVITQVKTRLKTQDSRHPKILDLCCGTGHLVSELSKIGNYTGLDFAPSMIEHCSVTFPKKKFVLGDAESLPFSDNSFDTVICFWSFHHIVYADKALDEIKRVLKPNGLLLIATFKDVGLNLPAKMGDWLSGLYWGYTTKRYSRKEMLRLMKPFNNVDMESYPNGCSWLGALGIRFLIVSGRK